MIRVALSLFGICLIFTFLGFWQAAVINILLGIWIFRLDGKGPY